MKLIFLLYFIISFHALAKVNIDNFVDNLKRVNALSVEEGLATLPHSLRDNYILQHNSSGLQKASMDSPRVFLYEDDYSFIITFNGDPSHSGYNLFEIMQFNEVEKKFEYYEIDFSKGAPSFPLEKNPAKCMECHGDKDDPHPIFSKYPEWPGFFGGDFDDMLNKEERIKLEEFNKKYILEATHINPRYNYLRHNYIGNVSDNIYYPHRRGYTTPYFAETYERPLSRFEMGLVQLKNKATFEKIKKHHLYKKLPKTLFYYGLKYYCRSNNREEQAFAFNEKGNDAISAMEKLNNITGFSLTFEESIKPYFAAHQSGLQSYAESEIYIRLIEVMGVKPNYDQMTSSKELRDNRIIPKNPKYRTIGRHIFSNINLSNAWNIYKDNISAFESLLVTEVDFLYDFDPSIFTNHPENKKIFDFDIEYFSRLQQSNPYISVDCTELARQVREELNAL